MVLLHALCQLLFQINFLRMCVATGLALMSLFDDSCLSFQMLLFQKNFGNRFFLYHYIQTLGNPRCSLTLNLSNHSI